MTRFVVDPGVVIRLATEERQPAPEHELLAPTLLRSQALSLLHEAVAREDLDDGVAQERLEAIGRMKIRLLGDAVLRRNAWRIADEMGWSDTYTAEYVALTVLQGDALVTLDATLANSLRGVVETARFSALF
jgi:predicted nucleic acid-binding protein